MPSSYISWDPFLAFSVLVVHDFNLFENVHNHSLMLYIVFFEAEFLFYITYMGGLGSIQYLDRGMTHPRDEKLTVKGSN